jgi:DNA polymerase-3 subunit beta
VRGKVEAESEIIVESKIISNFVALLPKDKVIMEREGNHLIISGGVHTVKINTASTEEYPVIPEVSKEVGHKLLLKDMRKALMQILPAVSQDDTRPEINGVLFLFKDSELVVVGTDSYRLGERKITTQNVGGKGGSCIVPLKTVKELIRTLDEDADSGEVYVTENQIAFDYGQTEMVSRLIDGKFPDYQQIIPSAFKYSFTITKSEFINAIKISGLFATVGSNSVSITLKPSERLVAISSATSLGEERTELSLDVEGTGDIRIAFDYRYLLDGLMSLDGEDVSFSANAESSPVLLKSKNELEKFIYIVMPIRQ